MLGIVFGVVCLVALVRVVRGDRFGRHAGRGWLLRRVFRRLDTGPGQERLVLTELDALKSSARELRGELRASRADLAAMVRDDSFDRGKVDALFRKQDELLGRMREAVAESAMRIHAALDPTQKQRLADMIERRYF